MAGEFLTGLLENISTRSAERRKSSMEEDRMMKEAFMKAMLAGELEPTGQPQAQPQGAGRGVAEALSQALGGGGQRPMNMGQLMKQGVGGMGYKTTMQPKKYEPTTREEALEFESAKAGMKPWKPQTREEQLKFSGEQELVKTEAQEQRKKDKIKADMEFSVNSVKNLMVPMIKSFRAMRDVTKRQTGMGAGRVAGAINIGGKIAGYNPEARAFEGQKLEVAAALARIAMPGIRSEKAIKTFLKTLPTEGSTDQEAERQIRNSVHNALSRGYAAQGLDYGPEEQAEAEETVRSILSELAYGEPGVSTDTEYQKYLNLIGQ